MEASHRTESARRLARGRNQAIRRIEMTTFFKKIRISLFAMFLLPLVSSGQSVDYTKSYLAQNEPGDQLYLKVRCNPRNLSFSARVRFVTHDHLIDANEIGVYPWPVYFEKAKADRCEAKVLGGVPESFFLTSLRRPFSFKGSSVGIPRDVLLAVIRDGVRLGKTELHLRFTGSTAGGYEFRRSYSNAITNICTMMATLCGDSEFIAACGNSGGSDNAAFTSLLNDLKRVVRDHTPTP